MREFTKHLSVTVLFLCVSLLAACSTTDLTSVKSPTWNGQKYPTVGVLVNSTNLVLREDVEHTLEYTINSRGGSARSILKVVNPILALSIDSTISVARDSGMSAVLLVARSGDPKLTMSGNLLASNSDGISRQEDFEFRLLDTKTRATIWMASTTTHADGMASINNAIAKRIATKLETDSVVVFEVKRAKKR